MNYEYLGIGRVVWDDAWCVPSDQVALSDALDYVDRKCLRETFGYIFQGDHQVLVFYNVAHLPDEEPSGQFTVIPNGCVRMIDLAENWFPFLTVGGDNDGNSNLIG